MCSELSPAFASAKILARQACYRPVTCDGLPLIGRVPGVEGAYVATGHSVWGILNAPATGEAMAELIADGAARSVDLSPFDPAGLRHLTGAAAQELGGFLAVDHPRCAELVDKHAKSTSPEGLLNRHLHRAFFRQRVEMRSASRGSSMPSVTMMPFIAS